MEEKEKQFAKRVYRCVRCGYIVTIGPEEKPPDYCPNCAVTHLMGKMELISQS